MGKGDKKTKRGKLIMGSFGNSRKSKPQKTKPAVAADSKKAKKGKA
jgi:30S ribosomal protein S31